jgi:geranylgeranyl reductase
MDYDVVIVGAGPGGLSCARNLKGSGLKVLVLEKNPKLGMKICSGEISPKVLPDEDFDRGHEWKSITIATDDTRRTLTYDRPYLWTMGREEFESYLMQGCDADVRFSESVTEITPEHVMTPKGKYRYKHLVGADGAFSIVRDHLNLPKKHIVGWAYHHVLEGPCPEFTLYWLPKTFPEAYGYVMSRGRDKAMAGIAWTGEDFDHGIAAKARAWMEKEFKPDGKSLKLEAMKGNADYRGWAFGNIFLVGEAAGLLNPCTTEGICYAVKSGEGVAKHILGNPEGKKIMESLASAHRWQVRMFGLATDTRLPFRWMINWILSDPRKGIRRKMLDLVFWRFMEG